MKELFSSVRDAFCLDGGIAEICPLPDGGIHAGYRIRLDTGKSFIFQQMNTQVFRNPEEVMQNIAGTAEYLRFHVPEMPVLHFYRTDSGSYFYQGWRVMDAIDGISMKSCENLHQIQQSGELFGKFQNAVSGMNAGDLNPVIPGFHDTGNYFRKLLSLHSCLPEVRILENWQEQACYVCDSYRRENIPFRVTHNDMKCSNLLFHPGTGQPFAVIDWDTVMPGMAVYDFGDAVRSFASKVNSSEPDFSKAGIAMQKFRAFASGWLSRTEYSPQERKLLIPAVFSVTVELAVRYLTDYLQGNRYFRISCPEQNLIRAKNQIALAQDILHHAEEMEKFL